MDNQQFINHLKSLIAIPSVSTDPEGDYPFGKAPYEALQYVLNLCKSYGFTTKQCGNHCGWAEIGQGTEIFGILVHLDVVPAGEGWDTDPFTLVEKDGKLFGRGVIDDKGPAIAVIHAMKDSVDKKIPLNKRVRIIFGTSEETGDEADLALYKQTEELPTMGFTPDADFPVVYLEKGIGEVELSMDLTASGLSWAEGGNASNMVPDSCTLTYEKGGDVVTVTATGKSAHGSMPWLGENAIGKAMAQLPSTVPIAQFYNKVIAMTIDGAGLGCHFADEASGGTTVNVGMIAVVEGRVVITLDIRCAISATAELLEQAIQTTVTPYGMNAELTFWSNPVYMDKESPFVKSLMQVYQSVTGVDMNPLIMGGGTYARSMDNIVAFGPVFPGRECTEHQANEYMYLSDLMQAKEIYYQAIGKLCQ
ncbi:Sapep family Mn(2+)-dependent dipeptidase [Bengtsoniella intestinalis]|uniref:Sapep family Mn(2+)-dependent dipeptidase n=1 Tax=Bengtsoniella intestinalis TaxID=3073143 RepID=UPI00391FC4C4